MSLVYPRARRDDKVKDVYHGVEVHDPYRWLENSNSQETKSFIIAQSELSKAFVEDITFKYSVKKNLQDLWTYPKLSPMLHRGTRYFQYKNSGNQSQNVLYTQETLYSKASVILDPNKLSKDGSITVSNLQISEDGTSIAYVIRARTSNMQEIRFKEISRNKDLKDVLRRISFSSLCWDVDSKGIFYTGFTEKRFGVKSESNRVEKLYYHKIGSIQKNDITITTFKTPYLKPSIQITHCGNYLLIALKTLTEDMNYVSCINLKLEKISKNMQITQVISTLEGKFDYITNDGTKFWFKTNKNAPNSKIIIYDKEHSDKQTTLIQESSKNVLLECVAVNFDQMILHYLKDVRSTLCLYSLESGDKLYTFRLDIGTITEISGRRWDRNFFFSFTSFIVPSAVYVINLNNDEMGMEMKVLQKHKFALLNEEDFETYQIFYTSKDGTIIPMFILRRKDFIQDGTRPCLLYGYGGFGLNLTPHFSASPLVFVDHFKGVFAVANIRGGGEYGEAWHKMGMLENKQNSFDDFQCAAKQLIKQRYTCARKLIIQGGSNGGLLIATCINQAPELFGAAICHVGVLDMLRFHKFTMGYTWVPEYGSSDNSQQFKFLYNYSPLHNVPDINDYVQFPATLLLVADRDKRVAPLHSLKFIAELQYKIGNNPNQRNPLLLRLENSADHGANTPTSKIIDEVVDIFCFFGKCLGLIYKKK